jgi:outer membrane protein assembly factor BamB
MMQRIGLTLACAIFLTNSLLWGMTPDELVQKTGIAGGLCSFPRTTQGDEKLALELAKRPTFVVHLLSQNAPAVARLRDTAEAAGDLGRSVYVEQGPAAPLPFADRLVDLLVVSDLRDADLTPELRSQWLRVLAPQRGAALVGRAKEAGEGLSPEALKAWAKDLPLARVFTDDSGVWALLKTELPPGSDPWSHRHHGAENTQVSSDTTLKAPFLTQWWGMPRQEGFWGTTVVAAGGRMFSMRSSRNQWSQVFLTARSLTSGVVLWQRQLQYTTEVKKIPHDGYVPGRGSMVAAGDALFVIDRDGVLRLNAETGAEQGRVTGPKPNGQVKWIACSGNLLVVLSGEPDAVKPIAYQTIADNPVGRELAVYEAQSGRLLWKDSLVGDVDERLIAAANGRLYCLVQGQALVCRELRTGNTLWTNTDGDLQSEFRTPASKVVAQLLFSQPVLSTVDDVVVLRAKWTKNTAVLSCTDGKLLWKKPSYNGSYRALTALTIGGLLIGGGQATNLKTGELTTGPKFISSGCGPTTAMPGYLITCFGAVSDMASGKMIRHEDLKSPCDVGSIVAEGLMVTVPSECGCNYEVKGYRALASAGAIQPHTASAWSQRLTVVDAREPAPLAITAADWPTYRHDAQRSAASTATVGEQPKILWKWSPAGAVPYSETVAAAKGPRLAPDFLATAPVAAAGYVWFASHDGIVRCIQAADGKEVWKFATGSMIFAPPTIHDGRALVGGGDGRIYCLDASTGRCLWQFQAAPLDRRVFWFGHLLSTWPAVAGVVVHDGVAFAVAGSQKENGIHAYAIDPKSGKVLWEKDDAGTGEYSNDGQIAVGGGKLWLCSSTAVPGSFDLQSGDWSPARGGHFGSEISVFDGKWVIHGGRRLSETQDTLSHSLGNSGFDVNSLEGKAATLPLNQTGTSLPAWDADLSIMPPPGLTGSLAAVPTAKAPEQFSAKAEPKREVSTPQVKVPAAPEFKLSASAATPAGKDQLTLADDSKTARPGKIAPKPEIKRLPAMKKTAADWSELRSWATENMTPIAFALAKDQVVVAYESAGRTRGYKASGFLRSDGSKAWTVDLPEQPVMNRLALDRDGRVLVTLCDGSVLCLGH